MEPSIITYTGDGTTKTFRFGFSFFQPADIVVEINGEPTTIQYALQIGKPNPTADMPYAGGDVCFATAPAADDEITIYREFVLSRPVDYQATTKLKTHEMNQDSNFHLENIRDLRHRQKMTDNTLTEHMAILTQHNNWLAGHDRRLDEHDEKIADIIERMSPDGATAATPGPDMPPASSVDLTEIENKISELESTISELTAQMETRASQSDITQIQSTITALNTQCANLSDQVANIDIPSLPDDMDYVVETQEPTADNNYTWYRKYASGWVEQGGVGTPATAANPLEIVFPIAMHDTEYTLCISAQSPSSTSGSTVHGCHYIKKTTTTCKIIALRGNSGDWIATEMNWIVCGLAN